MKEECFGKRDYIVLFLYFTVSYFGAIDKLFRESMPKLNLKKSF